MSTSSLYRLEIAPLTIIPLTRSPFFSYASSTSVPKGSLVTISFGRQTIEGVVYGCDLLPGAKPTWMKYCGNVIAESFLTRAQCELALRISDEYFTPLGRTLKHFLPKQVIAREKKLVVQRKLATLRPSQTERALVEKFLDTQDTLPRYFASEIDVTKRIVSLIGKAIMKKKKQVLVIVPEILLIPGFAAVLSEYFTEQSLVTLHSKLSDGASFSAWERIRSGEASIIIATRQGLFAPFRDLGAIIVTEEQDESYKQWDMSPRYHGKRVAAFLADLTGGRLLYTSGTPSLESLHGIAEKKIRPLRPLPKHADILPSLTIVNLRLERYRRNFSPLSEALSLALRDTLDRKEQALLYINRQGMNAFSVCESCKNVFRCKECDHPLTSTKDGHFRCTACGYVTGLFPNCPSCGHLGFRHVGFGTERIEKEVRKLFPKARITRLDSTTLRTPKFLEKTYQQGQENEIDILIGTQMILKDPPLPKLSLIAMIDADSMLLFPDFQADERLFRDLSRATRQVAKQPKGSVFVQTFRPDGAFFQKIAGKTSDAVLHVMLSERKELSYPPLTRFLSLTCQGKTEKEALKKAATLSAALEKNLPAGYRLSAPRKVIFLKKKTTFEAVILMRFPATTGLTEDMRVLLKRSSKDCLIDIDPISL